ncbi:MAG: hypothetical protein HC816_22375 [Leptolyngbyaceae cyanobacterium RM1_1_2]|nr:hypothetical protein [Leptolyngbyaceae cyanobacterium RM1_1_2]
MKRPCLLYSSFQTMPPATAIKSRRNGLVRALTGLGNRPAAIAQCQSLLRSPDPQVQDWAKRTLADLGPSQSTVRADMEIPAPTEDLSGFTPIDSDAKSPAATPSRPAAPAGSSGFAPIETPDILDTPDKPLQPTAPSLTDAASAHSDEPAPTGSLFQYQQLNAATGAPPPTAVPAAPVSEPSARKSAAEVAAVPSQIPDPPQADRLRSPQALPAQTFSLHLLSAATAIAWVWLSTWLLYQFTLALNEILAFIRWPVNPRPLLFFASSHPITLFLLCSGLVLASPWLFDQLLQRSHRLRSFSIKQLDAYSHESVLLLRRVCRQQGWLMPSLKLLPTPALLSFSYGFIPRYGRLVISQGALDQLGEDELAVLYARELARMRRWDWPVLSGLGLYLQGFYLGYEELAKRGDRQSAPTPRMLLGIASASCYSLYWLMRKVALGLARAGTAHSDRAAAALTGNPNGLIRVLLKIASTTATHIQTQQQVPLLLESIDLLTPLSCEFAVSGSWASALSWPQLLAWDRHNPYRHWLTFNLPQPLLGERIQWLRQIAQQWGLEAAIATTERKTTARIKTFSDFWHYWRPLLRQSSPFVGLLLGGACTLILWFIGGLASAFSIWQLDWLYQDRSLLYGSLLIGFGVGTLLRVNQLFPDIRPRFSSTDVDLPELYSRTELLPIDSISLNLKGELIGRSGLLNLLGQDLILKTGTGLIRLQMMTVFGPLGYLFTPPKHHPAGLVQRSVSVTGWFRRGGTIWSDVERLQAKAGKTILGQAPILSTWISLVAMLSGVYIIFSGG